MKKWTRMLGTVIAINLVVIVSVLLLRDWLVETDVKGGPSTSETAESKVPGELHTEIGDEMLPGNMGEVGGAETAEPEGTAGSDCQGETEGYAGTVIPGESEDHAGVSTPGEAGDHGGTVIPGEQEGQGDALSEAELIDRGKVIYLTFDDGPSKYTAELLDILAKYEVKATFFVTGGNEHYFDLIARQRAEGHTVGIHCFSHDYNTVYASETAYFEDLQKIDDIIFEQTGERAQLVRFPGGSSNQVSRFNPGIMTRLTAMVEQKGYRYFDWNVLSGDAEETEDTEEIIQNIISGIQKKDISVVLQHDIYQYSVDAVEAVIQWGLENGYTFLPLSMESLEMHHPIAN